MGYFPQLLSGAIVQYPFAKRLRCRTAIVTHLDGTSTKFADVGNDAVVWDFVLQGLNGLECGELESFFETMAGRLGEFTFLDPGANLLSWSEDLTAACWVKGPAIALSVGLLDPTGGNSAAKITNQGAAIQSVEQRIAAPSWFQYCFSTYLRSDQATRVTLTQSTSSTKESVTFTIGPNWKRYVHSKLMSSNEEQVTFGIDADAGVCFEVYGLQAEAQLYPSQYKRTTSRNGIYSRARFDMDVLSVSAEGPEAYSCRIRIIAPIGEQG